MPTPARPELSARDAAGAATLERMSGARVFNRWMYERIARWIGQAVLEIGAGSGNLSQYLVDRRRVVLTDTEAWYVAHLERRFADRGSVEVAALQLPETPRALEGAFDTVVCVNVLEHIEDDRASLEAMHRLLCPGGRLVLLVPALPVLFGSLDRALGHHRRYTPRLLRRRYADAHFRMKHLEWFNLAGVPGWWFVGRVLKREIIPTGSLALYDALVPLFRLERLLPWRVGQSLIAVGERAA